MIPPPRPLLLGGDGTAGSQGGDCGGGRGENMIEGKEKIRDSCEIFLTRIVIKLLILERMFLNHQLRQFLLFPNM